MAGRQKIAGIITDIQRMSRHNGPGLRTTIYFKGCPMHCKWCPNPECISFLPQELFYRDKCVDCGKCQDGCKKGARINCGKYMTSEVVFREIRDGVSYFGTQGGVTFAGGEPLAQPKFLAECIEYCKEAGIRIAIETSLTSYIPELLREMQIVIVDFKIWDEDEHRKWTGISNRNIKANLQVLDTLEVPIIVRTPVIPGVTADEKNIAAISQFVAELKNVIQYKPFPYLPQGDVTRAALGEKFPSFPVPDATVMKELSKYAFKKS